MENKQMSVSEQPGSIADLVNQHYEMERERRRSAGILNKYYPDGTPNPEWFLEEPDEPQGQAPQTDSPEQVAKSQPSESKR
jgi:hypothetical protein